MFNNKEIVEKPLNKKEVKELVKVTINESFDHQIKQNNEGYVSNPSERK